MMNLQLKSGLLLLRSSLANTRSSSLTRHQRRIFSQNVTTDNSLHKIDGFKNLPEESNSLQKIDGFGNLPEESKPKTSVLSEGNSRDLDDLAPELRPSFNFAAYANKSHTLQEMVKLGVDLSKWEKIKDVGNYILTLEFEEHMKRHIIFLHNNGVSSDELGVWLTKNPNIFREDLDDLQTRVNYLVSKGFDESQIARIVAKNPKWLMFSTVDIDYRLGFFQRTFKLTNAETRLLAVKNPRVITNDLYQIKRKNFAFLEEMGFTKTEIKSLILEKPKLWNIYGSSLLRRFDYAHNVMGLTHAQIVDFPKILTSRDFRLKQRHGFLKLIGRDQYDCTRPNYVSPDSLVEGDDVDFCNNVAKVPVQDFNNFLKTL